MEEERQQYPVRNPKWSRTHRARRASFPGFQTRGHMDCTLSISVIQKQFFQSLLVLIKAASQDVAMGCPISPFLPCFSVGLRSGSVIHRPGSTHTHRCRSYLQPVPAVVNSSCFHTEPSRNYVVESVTFKYNKFFKGQRKILTSFPQWW